ncbi:MAG: glycosyltransferase family 2 protein [Acidobacteria bacterium]|nr:glycosyltransferase family 2 protein [Acidobacteriota bacterium]
MSNRVSVTVGVPTYNNQDTIFETITSLRQQTYSEWECFITDDSCSSDTFDVAREAVDNDPRFVLIKNPQRLGAAGNWNSLLERATAPLFKLLCADDLLYENALEREVMAINEHPSAVLVTSRRDVIDSQGRAIFKDRGFHPTDELLSRSEVIKTFVRSGRNLFAEPSFALYDTAALRKGGGFDDAWNYTIDYVSYLATLQWGSLVPIDEPLGAFRISPGSWTSALKGRHKAEIRRCIDFASALPDSPCTVRDLRRGRAMVELTGIPRDLILRTLALQKTLGGCRTARRHNS